MDWRIALWAWVMFCALDLNRKNINRAISDNMVRNIGILPKRMESCDTDHTLG
jgi:hypothetical protein